MREDWLQRIADSYSLEDICEMLGQEPIWLLRQIEEELEDNIGLFDIFMEGER
jgi:hypothetical protein